MYTVLANVARDAIVVAVFGGAIPIIADPFSCVFHVKEILPTLPSNNSVTSKKTRNFLLLVV